MLFSDIDECAVHNFDCEQICNNLNGSAECKCHSGLRVDLSNPKKCVGELISKFLPDENFDFKNQNDLF